MIYLKDNQKFVKAGLLSVRSPSGEVVRDVCLYEMIKTDTPEQEGKLFSGKEPHQETIRFLAAKFKEDVKPKKRKRGSGE
jgi:hypothetical protein